MRISRKPLWTPVGITISSAIEEFLQALEQNKIKVSSQKNFLWAFGFRNKASSAAQPLVFLCAKPFNRIGKVDQTVTGFLEISKKSVVFFLFSRLLPNDCSHPVLPIEFESYLTVLIALFIIAVLKQKASVCQIQPGAGAYE